MLETNEDRLWINGLHNELDHDCHISPNDGCEVYLKIENAYMAVKEHLAKLRALGQLDGLFQQADKEKP